MEDDYTRRVLKGAWDTTLNLVGWSTQKAVSGIALLVGTVLFGGATAGFNLVTGSISVLAGLIIVGAVVFVWSIFETQREMYRELYRDMIAASNKQATSNPTPGGWAERKRPPANFEKYRHLPRMELQTAAQLWAGEQPGMGIFGEAKDNYAMLCGAIQSGELAIEDDPTIDPRTRNAVLARRRENPSPNMNVTRSALKAFAKLHGYDPAFLRDV